MNWTKVRYLKEPLSAAPEHAHWRYELELPQSLADWDVFDYWESAKMNHLAATLTGDDVLFDVGAEHGWQSAIFAKYFTPNLVLFEPTPEFWPNIRQTFERNELPTPLACVPALVGEHSQQPLYSLNGWPEVATGQLIDKLAYRYLHQDLNDPVTNLNDFVRETSVIPTAMAIDVEGAELLVLKGARAVLIKYKPKLWISIHPGLAKENYGVEKNDVFIHLKKLGYKAKHLATEHEEQWYFE